MTAERWKVVKTILQSAVERPAAERTAFVREACQGDDTVRQEVEMLLQAHEEAGDFLQGSVMDAIPHPAQDETMGTLIEGLRIGNYRIERELGRGGMGAVYLAVRADDEFNRCVAIKLIKRGMDTDEIVQRFRRERQILADLDHPYIARLLDGGTTAEGLPYFVMEYVEGQPVNVYTDVRKLSVPERLDLFSKICEAVQHAHTHHIIHRDVKPRNILVTKDGTPKLLDFGIAKILNPGVGTQVLDLTLAPQRLMTPDYASPEQVSGRPVSAASDVYSLGVLLYELLTGRKPYELWNRRMDEIARIICDEIPARPSSRRALDAPLDNIVLKAMRKDPLERYASAQEFANDIGRFREGQPILAGFHAGGSTETPTGPRTLAVLPFRTLRTEEHPEDYLGIALADALITKLTNIRRLTIRPTSSVHKYAHGDYDTLAAARELDVEYVLDGRTRRSGGRVRVTVQLIRVADSAPVWGAKFDEKFTDILTLEDSISGMVAEAIMPRLTGEEKELLSKRETDNPKAYESYLRGRYFLNKYTEEGLAKSLVCFMEAVAQDPNYARAHAGVAEYHSWLGAWCVLPPKECFAASMDAARKALALDPQLAEGHACQGWAAMPLHWDWAAAEAGLRKSIELHPSSTTYRWLAIALTCLGRHAEAIGEVENAQKLDPLSSTVVCTVALIFFNARQYGRALDELKRACELEPNNFLIHLSFGWCYLQKKMHPEALASARRAVACSNENQHAVSLLAYALGVSGQHEEARRVLAELQEPGSTRYVSPYLVALAQLGLGDREAALDNFEKAAEQRDWWVVWYGTEPRLDEIRMHPRFQALLRRIGLASPEPALQPASRPRPTRRAALAVAAGAAAMALLFGARTYFAPADRELPFASPQFTKLTTDGNATAAALSPDGRYVAYAALTGGQNALWVRQVAISNQIQIVPPAPLTYRGLAFSRDSNYVNYVVYRTNQIAEGVLYQVPVLGGAPRKLAEHVSGAVSVSPDNRQRAFLRSNPSAADDELIVLHEDLSRQKTVAFRKHPVRFAYSSAPAWSPDGKMIACAVEATDSQGFYVSILGFNVDTGAEKILAPLRWQYVEQMAWSPAGNGLIVAGRDQESSFQQVWEIAYPSGAARKLTNDLSNYYGISLSADASALVTVQKQTLSNIWVASKADSAHASAITPVAGRYFDLSWAPDGRIAYASDASGSADLWIMQADGSGQKQLTSNAHRNYAPSVSPDGQYIAFHSNRSGAWNIWRMDLDGGHPTQLTNDVNDSNWPQWTPDSKALVYHHIGSGGFQTLWRVPVEGGTPLQLSDQMSLRPIVSPRDGSIACWYAQAEAKPQWRLAVIPPQGGQPVRQFEFAPTVSVDTHLRWTPDGKDLVYSDNQNGVANLWIQPVEGGAPRQITSLPRDMIFAFDWARDGRLAYSRGFSTSDVVLMSEKK